MTKPALNKSDMGQKGFRMRREFLDQFDQFCEENGYSATRVFEVAIRHFMAIPALDRQQVFAEHSRRKRSDSHRQG